MYYTDRLGSFNIICCNAKIAERGTRKGTKLNQTVLYYSALRHCLKVGLSSSKKKSFYLFQWKPFKNDEKCFSFHLKSFICSQDIYIFVLTFWSCRKNGLIRTRMLRRISTSRINRAKRIFSHENFFNSH